MSFKETVGPIWEFLNEEQNSLKKYSGLYF